MRDLICCQCGNTFQTESKRKDKRMCPECLHKNKIASVMNAKKKRIPTTEIGVGSGNSSVNINRPLTIRTYSKVKKSSCELCGSNNYLLVHHINGDRSNNNIDNLQTLCKRCHQEHHTIRDGRGRYTRRIKTV